MGCLSWVLGGLLVIGGVLLLVFVLPFFGIAAGSTGFLVGAIILVVVILVGLYLMRKS